MPRRRRQPNPNVARPSPLTLQIDPNAILRVKMVDPDPPEKKINVPIRVASLIAALLFIGLAILWKIYIYPVVDPQQLDIGTVSVTMKHPAFVSRGDDNEIDVTVTNRGAQALSGTVALVFDGTAGARPIFGETTAIDLDKLGAGASITSRLKFDISQNASSRDGLLLLLRISTSNQQFPPRESSRILIAPFPYLKTVTSAAKVFSLSAIITSVVTLILNEIKKRLFGGEGK